MIEPAPEDSINDDNDEVLAQMERVVESGTQPALSALSGTESKILEAVAEHYRFYNLIEQLAAPVRLALGGNDSPPTLPDYESLEEIGRGGMGVVYRGLHRKLRRQDAIKVIRPDRLCNVSPEYVRQMQSRFEQELRVAACMALENIVPVYQVGEVDGCLWFSMQFVDGGSLLELCRTTVVAPEQIVVVIERIARAVDKLHRHGILHGDIKPHNILIERETNRPLISDFGLAEFDFCSGDFYDDSITATIAGTPAYMAPELLNAVTPQTSPSGKTLLRSVSSDVYSLGATLWATLTGQSPIEVQISQSAMSSESRSLPSVLLKICRRSMSDDPASRHQSAREFADELAHWLNRPRWNQYFPGLRNLLWMIVAPWLFASNCAVWFLMRWGVSEVWIWSLNFSSYVPLFLAFFLSQKTHLASNSARRELWSIWIGHAVGTVACMISLRVLMNHDLIQLIPAFYCGWAAVTSVVLFAKSGNFWTAYRWIGIAWSIIAVAMAIQPGISPIVFGASAAITCIIIARGDQAFSAGE